jgi:hypothetical protein
VLVVNTPVGDYTPIMAILKIILTPQNV